MCASTIWGSMWACRAFREARPTCIPAMPSFPGFINGSAPSASAIATSERTVNFYVEKIGTHGPQSKIALYPTPGQLAWITAANSLGVLTDVGGRGGIWTGTRAFVAIGGGLYEVFA